MQYLLFQVMAFPQSNLPIGEILKQLTLEEKVSLLSGKTNWRTAAIPRLGIRAIKV
jgi:beta-glucosidase